MKLIYVVSKPLSFYVAPFAGAWIEISMDLLTGTIYMSLPSRERGLKSRIIVIMLVAGSSLPSRERGLKFVINLLPLPDFRRSLRGSVD